MKTTTTETTLQLTQKLTQFGLNPKDWQLRQKTEKIFEVICSDLDGLCFLGTIGKKNGSWDWEKLTLAEI